MSKIIKNLRTDSTVKYAGQIIAAEGQYLIPSDELESFQNSDALTNDLTHPDQLTVMEDSESPGQSIVGMAAVSFLLVHMVTVDQPTDSEGIPFSKPRMTQTGWHFQYHSIEWTTSKLASVYNCSEDCVDLGFTTMALYDDTDTLITTQGAADTDCVKTVVTWEPGYSIEALGGTLHQGVAPTSDVRLWITAVPDIPVIAGGSIKYTQGGLNLRHLGIGPVVEIDGKTAKLMPYHAVYHSSKFKFTIRHDAGIKHSLMMSYKMFKDGTT